jgi:exosortase A
MSANPVHATKSGADADFDTRRPPKAPSWPWAIGAMILGIGVVLALYWDAAYSIGFTWWDSPAFSHGFLILPIVAYLIWLQRHKLMALPPRPSALGLAAVALGSLGWLVGETAGVLQVQQIALVFVLQGVVLSIIGRVAAMVIAFPLFYLYFGVPFGTFLIPPLQDVTAAFVVRSLQLIGMPVHIDGIFIYIPTGNFEVAEACAGLRFLITSVALGVIFAYEFYTQLWRRLLFIALSIVVPIIANGFRATGIVLLAHYSDYELAVGADHLTYGLIFLSIVLFCLLGIGYSFREPYRAPAASAPGAEAPHSTAGDPASPDRIRLVGAALGAALISTTAWIYAAQIQARAGTVPEALRPLASAGWQASAPAHTDWKPSFPTASREFFQGYSDGVAQVDVYVAYYARQQQGEEVVNFLNSVSGAKPWQRAGGSGGELTLNGDRVAYNYERVVAGERGRMVRYWYWVDGQVTASPYVAKLLEVRAKLLGGEPGAAVVAVAADYRESPREANDSLDKFLKDAWPVGRFVDQGPS